MFSSHRPSVAPESIPVLSRGRHRSPRRGACFMEMASLLAGQRWSDHPRCTHPLLAALARMVNDCTSDARRSELAPLVPSVIGLTADDLRVDARIALRCAQAALPVASAERQKTLAVAILAANRVLAQLDGSPADQLDEPSRHALDEVPEAARWAAQFVRHAGINPRGFRRHTATAIVRSSVLGIVEACIADVDDVLHELLTGAIGDVAALCAQDGVAREASGDQLVSSPGNASRPESATASCA